MRARAGMGLQAGITPPAVPLLLLLLILIALLRVPYAGVHAKLSFLCMLQPEPAYAVQVRNGMGHDPCGSEQSSADSMHG